MKTRGTLLTIASLELVISGYRNLLIVDESAIGRFEINNERSDRCTSIKALSRSVWERTNFITPLEPPYSSFSLMCRSENGGIRYKHCST
jgi:hypothetical protein